MGKTLSRSESEAQYICTMAPFYKMRTGQLLFNMLRYEVAEVVRSTELDTFYKNLEFDEIVDWLDNHIIFDNFGTMVRLFSGHTILWQDVQWEEDEYGNY